MIPLRLARELTYQLEKAGEYERLATVLASLPVFVVLYEDEGKSEVLESWQRLSLQGHDPTPLYKSSLDRFERTANSNSLKTLWKVSSFFEARGEMEVASQLLIEMHTLAERSSDARWQVLVNTELGDIARKQCNYDVAADRFTKALALAEPMGNLHGMSRAICNLGIVRLMLGYTEEAQQLFERSLEIAERCGSRSLIAMATGNLAFIHRRLGKHTTALALIDHWFRMAELEGDKRGMGMCFHHRAAVYHDQGRTEDALQNYERALSISESLGDKGGVGNAVGCIAMIERSRGQYEAAIGHYQVLVEYSRFLHDPRNESIGIGNIGNIYHDRGRYDEALKSHKDAIELAEIASDKMGVYRGVGNIGNVYFAQGRFEEALEQYTSALNGHRELKFAIGVAHWLPQMAASILGIVREREKLGDSYDSDLRSNILEQAREYVAEALQIGEGMSSADTLFIGQVLLARIDAAEGHITIATGKLEAMLAETSDEEQTADLHYWIWKISAAASHRNEAITLLASIFERIPTFEFRKRLAELRGEPEPQPM